MIAFAPLRFGSQVTLTGLEIAAPPTLLRNRLEACLLLEHAELLLEARETGPEVSA